LINLKKLLKLDKSKTENRQFENLLQDIHGENFNLDIGGTWDMNSTGTTYTRPVEFNVDEIVNKSLEYSYTLKAIDKGGIPE